MINISSEGRGITAPRIMIGSEEKASDMSSDDSSLGHSFKTESLQSSSKKSDKEEKVMLPTVPDANQLEKKSTLDFLSLQNNDRSRRNS